MTRNPDAAGLPPQVKVVRGDLTVAEILDRCLQAPLVIALIVISGNE